MRRFLERTGYALDARVDEPGEAAFHGQVVDVFPAGSLAPVRIELRGNRIAAINSYDPVTQRSGNELPNIVLDAASEIIVSEFSEAEPGKATATYLRSCDRYSPVDTIFDCMPEARLVIDPDIDERAQFWTERIREGYEAINLAASKTYLVHIPSSTHRYLGLSEWREQLQEHHAERLPGCQTGEVGQGDILLTTNIIETGVDLPRVNTILIRRPDRFGAAQLHQLRGRVGRGRRRGIAYLLTDPEARLPEHTRVRLQSFTQMEGLGAGFAVSQRDLNLRGAGDLAGEARAGHIKQVGVELYRYLLDRVLSETQSTQAPTRAVDVRLDVPASIPRDYVAEPEIRINLYARLARLRSLGDIDNLADEIEDRFGPPPPALRNLIEIASIRELAAPLGITHLHAGPIAIALTFEPSRMKEWELRLNGFAAAQWSDDRAIFERPSDMSQRIGTVRQLIDTLISLAADTGNN